MPRLVVGISPPPFSLPLLFFLLFYISLPLHSLRPFCSPFSRLMHRFASVPPSCSFLSLSALIPSLALHLCSTLLQAKGRGGGRVLTVYFDLDLREISRNSLGAGGSLGKDSLLHTATSLPAVEIGTKRSWDVDKTARACSRRDFAAINKIRIAPAIRTIDYTCSQKNLERYCKSLKICIKIEWIIYIFF